MRHVILKSGRVDDEGRIVPWRDNGELLADVQELLLDPSDVVLDPTFGEGVWWSRRRPPNLVTMSSADGANFTNVPLADESIDVAAYDPPYVCPGGRTTSTIQSFFARYGLRDVPPTPRELQELMNAGAREMTRLLRPPRKIDGRERGGLLLWKCSNYIWSGRPWLGVWESTRFAIEELDLVPVDEFVFVGAPGPQPGGRTRKCPACGGLGYWTATPDEVAHGAPPPPAPFNTCARCEGEKRVESGQQHTAGNVSVLLAFRRRGARSRRSTR